MGVKLGRLLALLAVAALVAYFPAAVVQAQAQKEIVIGGLLPLTGDLSDYGKRADAAIKVAVEDVNAYLAQKNAWFRLSLRVEDTGTNPDLAVQKMNTLISAGVKFFIGPMTSGEVTKVKDIANQNKVLIISPSSTAIQLAIPGDNLYRFCTDDSIQSKADARVIEDFGAKAAVIIVRADTWGQGLKDATMQLFNKAGIEYKTYEYNPESPNFAALASQVAQDVKNYIAKYGASKVAVVLVSFKEGADFFHHASNYPELKSVLWYGSDGTARLSTITDDVTAATFSEQTLFLNPMYAPAASENQKIVDQKVYAMIKDHPDAYSLAAYDAVWAIALSLLDANPNATPDDLVNHVKAKLDGGITNSQEFAAHSATGAFPLNAAGDRATADYDLWLVINGKWVLAGKYYGNQDKAEWFPISEAGNKTYLDLVNAKFQGEAPATTTTTPTGTQAAGTSTGTIAAAVIVIIIIAAAALLLARRK